MTTLAPSLIEKIADSRYSDEWVGMAVCYALRNEERCTGCADWCDCHNFDTRCLYCSEDKP